ncbi:hypothetical protein HOY80DRAFT_1095829 [Tuber brumale]|nr:hypothetical protein HOY80DRAFT_1095829 [Tuber brumale]
MAASYLNLAPGHKVMPASRVDNSIPISTIDDCTEGPGIVHLPHSPAYDAGVISDYITSTLNFFDTDNAYGLLAGVTSKDGLVVPALLFGVPGYTGKQVVMQPTPYNLPTLIKEDRIVETNEYETRWNHEPVHDYDQITLDSVSIGIEANSDTAGSFGGFLKRNYESGQMYGITAAHCVPGGDLWTPVCCPSTLEVNLRLTRLIRYTTLCPAEDQLKFNESKDTEAKALLQRFRFSPSDSGTTILDPAAAYTPQKGILLGRRVGRILRCQFETCANTLYDYDQNLAARNIAIFGTKPHWRTRMDWGLFSVDPTRYGGNIYDGEIIEQRGFLYPGALVEKMGRTTEVRDRVVNGYFLQRWHSSQPTYEVAIMRKGGGGGFAEVGDSGGCLFEKTDGGNKAAGILIGKNLENNFVLATPLDLILTSAPQYTWA